MRPREKRTKECEGGITKEDEEEEVGGKEDEG